MHLLHVFKSFVREIMMRVVKKARKGTVQSVPYFLRYSLFSAAWLRRRHQEYRFCEIALKGSLCNPRVLDFPVFMAMFDCGMYSKRRMGNARNAATEKTTRIFLFTSTKGWQDATDRIAKIDARDECCFVLFSSGKRYPFSWRNINVLEDCEILPISESFPQETTSILYRVGKRLFVCDKARGLLEISEEALKTERDLRAQAEASFGYYSALAKLYDQGGDEESSFLESQYERIHPRWFEPSVLKDVLSQSLNHHLSPRLVFPFPHNLSQMEAVEKAFSNNVSVIQGPPGTGKTQTILNLIANILLQEKTVAVISNNNLAVDNVYEKMEAEWYGFLCARLGNLQNRQAFFASKHERSRLPEGAFDPNFWNLLKKERLFFQSDIKKAKLLEEKARLQLQFDRFETEQGAMKIPPSRSLSSKSALRLAAKLEKRGKKRIGFLRQWVLRLLYGIDVRPFQGDAGALFEALNRYHVARRLGELSQEIETIEWQAKEFRDSGCSKKILQSSKALLNQSLNARFQDLPDEDFDADNFKQNFEAFIKRYPVILSSTYSLPTSAQDSFQFDYLIIDEASQSTITTVLPSLAKGKNLIVIGDDKQLPPVLEEDLKKQEEQLCSQYGINGVLRDDGKSFLTFLQKQMPPSLPVTLLREHYRCAPEIIGFSNERIYGGELILEKPRDHETHLGLLKTVPGNHARKNDTGGTGQYNQREIDEILNIIETLPSDQSIGVITPYRRQAELLRKALSPAIEVGTIHAFQGRERDIILLSTVANSAEDYQRDKEIRKAFINDERMINVAVTRAKEEFILVTSDKITRSKTGILADLVKYIRYQTNSLVLDGQIRSIFDLLYEDYAEERKRILKGGGIASEELVENLLKSILLREEFSSLRHAQHLPLKSVVKIDASRYEREEAAYLSHPWTHLDFVIFNKFDNAPLLAIEVDGIAYHEQNEKQKEKDSIKDRCLRESGLPLLRLKTQESGIEERIVSALKEAMR